MDEEGGIQKTAVADPGHSAATKAVLPQSLSDPSLTACLNELSAQLHRGAQFTALAFPEPAGLGSSPRGGF